MQQSDKESMLIMEIAAYVQEHNAAAQWEMKQEKRERWAISAKQRGAFATLTGITAIVLFLFEVSQAATGVATGLFLYNGTFTAILLLLIKKELSANDITSMNEALVNRATRARSIESMAREIWGDKGIRVRFDKKDQLGGILDVLACLGVREEFFDSDQGTLFQRNKSFA